MPEIQNPNLHQQGPAGSGGGGGDMRSMLAVMLLVVLVFVGFQYFKPKAPEPAQTAQTAQPAASQTPSAPPQQSPSSPAQQTSGPIAPVASQSAHAIGAAAESETTIENEQYKIVFTNRGGEVKHWILKRYYDSGGAAGGHHLDLVQPQTSARFGYPLSFFTYESALATQLNQALYQVTATGSANGAGSYAAPASLTFHYAQNGIDAVKTIRFDSSYVITVETQVTRNGEPVRALVSWPAGLGDMEEFLPASAPSAATRGPVPVSASSQIVWSVDGNQTTRSPNGGGFLFWTSPAVSNNATIDLPFQYAALSDLYFAAAFLPDHPERATMVTLHNAIDIPGNLSEPGSEKRPGQVLGVAIGDTSGYTRLRLFAGPKQMEALAAIRTIGADGKPDGPSLEPLIQFGTWLGFIAKPLFLALRFLFEHGIPNWGWAIIIVTVVFNLAMLPTRLMAMRSSLKMMRIQPKVDALKKKYAQYKVSDPKRAEMNSEMMDLYKRENVNMYAGCLPMLPQLPLLYGYYRVLANVIELRQAHWLWLGDLSAPDPLHILPILIVITMFLTQYITPSPGMDPAQRRMMAFMMPMIFGFTLWHYASGLALYWGTGNIINLGMQIAINRSSIGREMHDIAARRAKKNSPGSKGKH